MVKKKILLTFLIPFFALFAEAENFALFTIPKSGSHLMMKTLYFMTGRTPAWHITPPSLTEVFNNQQFPYTHCCLTPSLLNFYSEFPIKTFLGVRDLRDVCVSIVYQILKGAWPEFTGNIENVNRFKKLSFDEQLLFVINHEPSPSIRLHLGIKKVAEQVLSLSNNPQVLVCKYEDLVGKNGGGSRELQKQILRKMGEHIGIYLTDSQISELITHLYGNRDNPFGRGDFANYQSTFREGKIGGWKTEFKQVHKDAFKKRLGKELIALGYEVDNNW